MRGAGVWGDGRGPHGPPRGPCRPRNSGRRFHGPVRAREALASSFNVPAVSLTDQLGVAVLLRTLHQAGFTTLDHSAEFYGLGLALGNGDGTLLELANAYPALANAGARRPYPWRRVPGGGGGWGCGWESSRAGR